MTTDYRVVALFVWLGVLCVVGGALGEIVRIGGGW
jgi:hypothetical protein